MDHVKLFVAKRENEIQNEIEVECIEKWKAYEKALDDAFEKYTDAVKKYIKNKDNVNKSPPKPKDYTNYFGDKVFISILDRRCYEWRFSKGINLSKNNNVDKPPSEDTSATLVANAKKAKKEELIETKINKNNFLNYLRSLNENKKKDFAEIICLSFCDSGQISNCNLSEEDSTRLSVFAGQCASIIFSGDLEKEQLAYFFLLKHQRGNVFNFPTKNMFFLYDHSWLFDDNGEMYDRYNASKEFISRVSRPPASDLTTFRHFVAGYHRGTDINAVLHLASANEEELIKSFYGYFNEVQQGLKSFCPLTVSWLRRSYAMRGMLEAPQVITYIPEKGIKNVVNMIRGREGSANLIQMKAAFKEAKRLQFLASATENHFLIVKADEKAGALFACSSMEDFSDLTIGLTRKSFIGDIPSGAFGKGRKGDKRELLLNLEKTEPLTSFRCLRDRYQEFLLLTTAIQHDSGGAVLASETVINCFHYIFQYPDLMVEHPSVLHLLYNQLFQRGLIEDLFDRNPDFFISFNKKLSKLLAYLDGKETLEARFTLLDICERIREKIENASGLKEIRDINQFPQEKLLASLPRLDFKALINTFSTCETLEQRIYAVFVLLCAVRSFRKNNESLNDVWGDVLNAYHVYKNSKVILHVHPLVRAQLDSAIQSYLLPFIHVYISNPQNQAFRNNLLSTLAGSRGEWQQDPGTSYQYKNQEGLVINLLTTEGFITEVREGFNSKLPIEVTKDENYVHLFGDWQPTSVELEIIGKVKSYRFVEPSTEIEMQILHLPGKEVRIYQFYDGNRYLFLRLTPQMPFFKTSTSQHQNTTIEEKMKMQGVWMLRNGNETPDSSVALLAKEGLFNLKDAFHLDISGRNIREAFVIENGVKKKVVSSLKTEPDQRLFSFRRALNVVLLSEDDKLSEIRFPDGLVLKRTKKDEWIDASRPHWCGN